MSGGDVTLSATADYMAGCVADYLADCVQDDTDGATWEEHGGRKMVVRMWPGWKDVLELRRDLFRENVCAIAEEDAGGDADGAGCAELRGQRGRICASAG